ncbi:hypothetical protein HFO97_27240 [Rhizobium leguminosarum]|uniref:hypothetical protein n=1 Tax=Rhizobium leguminosarum TaxID=384 RepID=UPI001C968E49|nr:hypothetical protein [Rhizobium leguminosarum]MBY5363578.1 hypothetical protein [Rhizobium leguminosarum]
MITIGIRAAPKVITFAIYDTDEEAILNVEEIKIPAAFDTPSALKYVRSNLLDVLREYEVERAGVRITEGTATPNVERIQIEGVIQEAFASSELQSYYVGQIASMAKRLGIERERVKPLVNGEDDIGIENWKKMGKEEREAILCAIGAKNA